MNVGYMTGEFLYIREKRMHSITNKQYEEYRRYLYDKNHSRIITPDFVYLLHRAYNCNPEAIGKQILECYGTYRREDVFLNVEMPDPKAVNAVQRERRLAFYERNGYHRADSWIVDGGERYLILSLDESYNLEAYARLLRRFSFGLYRSDIRSRRSDAIFHVFAIDGEQSGHRHSLLDSQAVLMP